MNQQTEKSWLKTNFPLFIRLFALLIVIVGFSYGDKVSANSQKEIVGFLVTISAIIFGVMGAWLSITKVELQLGIDSAETNELANSYMERARGMIEPVTLTSIVLICSILFMFASPVLSAMEISYQIKMILKSISFSMISLMAFIIIYCLGIVIFQGAGFLLELSTKNQENRANRGR
ncbi:MULTISPECIES: hypothetical protein [Vibrionaceae]|uniref:hypothetical protein n=1 Tax=Vibrionaceae TaxID=641 RepID=UPI0025769812|nr:hypothetical protein [Vibrio ordalii]MCS0351025.1 hypothetical protein [Vibrio ordalii]